MTEIDPALARKRRKEIMQSLRAGETEQQASSNAATTTSIAEATETHLTNVQSEEALPPKKRKVSENSEASESDQQKEQEQLSSNEPSAESDTDNKNGSNTPAGSKIVVQNGKKTQIRYDPDVPMSKEQLAAWRREARRVRNRESAAASRQRIRDRINELEDEVGEWKTKYREAMERLQQVEQMKAAQQQSR
mmetsp:Transcript_4902/g.7433  ORF Transcript_4902/g.7433 Transcript_4902/m.7433 type:complete len:192 (-) Transcript_4902:223-798(-)|eukprot:CAMPEP_0195292318 /NCGR_PEP_ID=MMETSP0707-20130614/8999_1 /TAXON_ID=33640 /ORGANISM="Asterionellopsis glacialis, Strain CCMP134" /LENGTH=191 /DNA_ID=CAMNT_0040352743 /DNA_START=151 /DNA_END=726 /DNA_ORIENTATION=+